MELVILCSECSYIFSAVDIANQTRPIISMGSEKCPNCGSNKRTAKGNWEGTIPSTILFANGTNKTTLT